MAEPLVFLRTRQFAFVFTAGKARTSVSMQCRAISRYCKARHGLCASCAPIQIGTDLVRIDSGTLKENKKAKEMNDKSIGRSPCVCYGFAAAELVEVLSEDFVGG